VLEWIRQQPKLRTMFVLVLSSSGLEQDRCRAYALGADNYAVKPSDPSEMIRLAQHLEVHLSRTNTTPSSDCFTT
jgi:DNA-binding response OmpR family regulator